MTITFEQLMLLMLAWSILTAIVTTTVITHYEKFWLRMVMVFPSAMAIVYLVYDLIAFGVRGEDGVLVVFCLLLYPLAGLLGTLLTKERRMSQTFIMFSGILWGLFPFPFLYGLLL